MRCSSGGSLWLVEIRERKLPSKVRCRLAPDLLLIRKRSGLIRTELARIAEVSPRMVAKYESREKDINHAQSDVVVRLAVALHVDPADLCERVIPNNDYSDFRHGG